MQLRIDDIRKAGTDVVAISPDATDVNRRVAAKLGIGYRLLSDPDLKATDAFGVRHPDALRPADSDIPRPAVFIVDGNGHIVWKHLTDNWRVRVRPERLLEVLATLP